MVRINHIDIVDVGGRRFVGQIDRMVERQIPNRESFVFGINAFDTFWLSKYSCDRQVAILPLPGPGAVTTTSGRVVSI